MAASVQLSTVGSFNFARRDAYARLMKCLAGDAAELKRLQRGLAGGRALSMADHDIVVRATTDTNTAAGSSNVALNLSTLGLTTALGALATNERRDVVVECIVVDAANSRRYHWAQRTTIGNTAGELVAVGKNPVFLTDCTAQVVCTSANGTAMTEVAAQCVPPAWWDGAAPVAADVASNATVVSWLGGNAPVGAINPLSVCYGDAAAIAADARVFLTSSSSLTNGTTSFLISDVATPTAADLTSGGEFQARADVKPPCSAVLAVNTSAAPDELILSLVGISSVALAWTVGVTVGDPYVIA